MTRVILGSPSLVICFDPVIRGDGSGARQNASPATNATSAGIALHFRKRIVGFEDAGASASTLVAAVLPDSVSRRKRLRSVSISAAERYRRSQSFSSALLMIRSSSAGRSGFSRTGATGARFTMASQIIAEVSPRNGNVPVAISYNTAPKEYRSVRASKSLPRTCSGDM